MAYIANTKKRLKMTETTAHGDLCESAQWEPSNEYHYDKV